MKCRRTEFELITINHAARLICLICLQLNEDPQLLTSLTIVYILLYFSFYLSPNVATTLNFVFISFCILLLALLCMYN